MNTYSRITPEGTRDILFEECRARREIQTRLARVFSLRGYHEVITPGIEYYDLFDLPGASIPQQEMYKSTDNGGRLIVFRPDSTLPIARMAAARLQSYRRPVRLYYCQNIFRNRPDLSGRNDESAQMGIELMGASGRRADLEVISAAVDALGACAEDFRLEIGHARFFKVLADRLTVSEEKKEQIRSTIESKNYAALDELLNPLGESDAVEAMKNLPRLFGGEEVLKAAERYCTDAESAAMLDELKALYGSLRRLGLGDKLMVDLGLVQRNDYYTGVVFSAYVQDQGDAVLFGGRYDSLLEKFDAPMPAVGFAVDVDAIASQLLEKQVFSGPQAEVLVHGDEGYEIEAQKQIGLLTEQGVACVNSVFGSFEESLAYAKELGIRKILRVGSHTVACNENGEVMV